MSFAILSIGTALPTTIVSQHDAKAIARSLCCRNAENETWLPAMYDQTGIHKRHLALGDEVLRDLVQGTQS